MLQDRSAFNSSACRLTHLCRVIHGDCSPTQKTIIQDPSSGCWDITVLHMSKRDNAVTKSSAGVCRRWQLGRTWHPQLQPQWCTLEGQGEESAYTNKQSHPTSTTKKQPKLLCVLKLNLQVITLKTNSKRKGRGPSM